MLHWLFFSFSRKELTNWAKILKAKNAVRVSVSEKLVCIPHAL